MERYCTSFSDDVTTWESTIKKVDQLPFECVYMLGHGEHCVVYTIIPNHLSSESESVETVSDSMSDIHWSEEYFKLNDVEGSMGEPSFDDESESTQDEVDTTTLTITTPSPMGDVEVVAKKFLYVSDDVCYEARHPDTQASLVLECNADAYIKWLEGCPDHVTTNIIRHRITPATACFNGFVTESLCHLLITDLVAAGVTPHLTMAFRAVQKDSEGYLILERITGTLEDILQSHITLTAGDVAGFYFQTLFTLHILQEACRFKHHDLHTENVFLRAIDDAMEWKGQKLKDATHFEYCLADDVRLYLPNRGFIVKLGDFGMASMDIYGRRLQRLDMETYATDPDWGDWNSTFVGYEGYDMQVLMGAPPFDTSSHRMNDERLQQFMRHLRRAVQGGNGKLTRRRLRPLSGHVSRETPMTILRKVFVQHPGDDYNFTTAPPEGSVIVNLGDVRDLHRAVSTPSQRRRASKRKNKPN